MLSIEVGILKIQSIHESALSEYLLMAKIYLGSAAHPWMNPQINLDL